MQSGIDYVDEASFAQQRAILICRQELNGNLQRWYPLMRRLILGIQVNYCDEPTAVLQHAVNLFQRNSDVRIVVERFHRERMRKLVILKWQMLGRSYFKTNVRVIRRGRARQLDH